MKLVSVGGWRHDPQPAIGHPVQADLPFEVRTGTSEERKVGTDRPDFVLARELVDRYARRMVIENTDADAIDFFHMDALSAAVPLKVHLDLQINLMASALYRILARRLGNGMESARARTLFRKVFNASATIENKPDEITVSLGRRANNPLLIVAGFADQQQTIP